MKHEIKHDLPVSQAKKAVDKAFESYSTRFADYQPTLTWVSDKKANVGFSVKGMNLKGSFEITENVIVLDLDVPFVLRPFKNVAVGVIEKEVATWIGKAKAGQLDN